MTGMGVTVRRPSRGSPRRYSAGRAAAESVTTAVRTAGAPVRRVPGRVAGRSPDNRARTHGQAAALLSGKGPPGYGVRLRQHRPPEYVRRPVDTAGAAITPERC